MFSKLSILAFCLLSVSACVDPVVGFPLPDATDAITPDAITPDAITPDAITPDAITPDAITPDAITPDAITPDAITPDAEVPDALTPDAEVPDAEVLDAELDAALDAEPDAALDAEPDAALDAEPDAALDAEVIAPIIPQVIATLPEDLASGVAVDTAVTATFDAEMDPLTLTADTFTLTGPAELAIDGVVTYELLTRTATFMPFDDLLPDTEYTAVITAEVADLLGTPLADDHIWTFTTAEEPIILLPPVNLRSLTTFALAAGAGLTNSNSGGFTVINGDVALSPTATCMSDGVICGPVSPTINGTLYANDAEGVAAQAMVDLTAAYEDAMSRPVGVIVNDLTGMVLAPGVYTSDSTMSVAVGGTVTLDGVGDPNAVFIFQIGSSLTVNNNAQILLVNGARAENVFWAVFASSTLGGGVAFQGNVLAGASNSVGTGSTVLGRLLCRIGQITLLANTITRPLP